MPRKSVRLKDYDYRTAGAYFVTICTFERACFLDEPAIAAILRTSWRRGVCGGQEPSRYDFVVMPNHVHGIVWLPRRPNVVLRSSGVMGPTSVGVQRPAHPITSNCGSTGDLATTRFREGAAPLRRPECAIRAGSLGAVVRSFKSAAALRINQRRNGPGMPVWQRGYHETIIRDERHLLAAQLYIADNPLRWPEDPNHPWNWDAS